MQINFSIFKRASFFKRIELLNSQKQMGFFLVWLILLYSPIEGIAPQICHLNFDSVLMWWIIIENTLVSILKKDNRHKLEINRVIDRIRNVGCMFITQPSFEIK